ncbi:MAG: hypothetical protein ACRDY1_02270 [Acidimicrobiales bacterium]
MLRRLSLIVAAVAVVSAAATWWSTGAHAAAPATRHTCASTGGGTTTDRVPGSTTTTLVPPSPVIDAFRPFFGNAGDVVHIRGRFLCNATVSFNGTSAVTFGGTLKKIEAIVPAGATTGPIRVTTPEGTVASSQSYTVM